MIIQISLSVVLFILLFETSSVLTKAVKRELEKDMELGASVNKINVAGVSSLSLVGFYVVFCLVSVIWAPDIQPSLILKIFTSILAASYILGVLGLGFSMKKAPEFGELASRMPARATS